jgi:DNA-binding response OmpR family regulator
MSNRADDVPVLVAQTGLLIGSRWIIDKDEIILGRGEECDYHVDDRQVSREHARIRRTDRGYLLEDLDSKNGTFLNGSPVKSPQLLQDGDVIQVALAVKIMFIGTESTIPLSMSDAAQMGLGRLRMDDQAHRVWVGDTELEPPLSLPQFRLLHLLYLNPERVITRHEVIEEVWPESIAEGVSEQAIDALIRRLRERLSDVDPEHNYVVTVRGHGFRLDNPI